jgi:protein TonB
MNKDIILRSDVLDIIFDRRNKAYGAYDLRKYYPGRLMKSLLLVFGGVLVLCAFRFLPEKEELVTKEVVIPGPELGKLPEKQKQKEPEPAKKEPVAKQKPAPSQIFVSNIKVVDAKKDSTTKLVDITNVAIGSVTNTTVNPGTTPVVVPVTEPGTGTVSTPVVPAEPPFNPAQPISDPEVAPSFPGGMDALRKFLERNLTNPRDLEEGENISVKVRFVVGYDGKLQGFETVQDGGAEFNKEVVRVLKKMPEWVPGKTRGGKNVAVYYTIPVKFVPYN